jgi:hypothetical protein
MGEKMNRRGQVAIFVIVAIVIVGILLVVFLVPGVREGVTGDEFSPTGFLKDCVEPSIKEGIELLSRQGGYSNPEGFVLHEGEKVKYLCYSAQNYETCVVQQPMIKNYFEGELAGIVEPVAKRCSEDLISEYEKRGFTVSASAPSAQVSVIPSRIRVDFLAPMTITKDNTQTFRGFDVEIQSEMYDLLLITQSIIEFESTYGDSETTLYLQYYPNLRIEKLDLQDGSTIYKIGDVSTGEEFTFASRSVAWPPGYGL